MNRELKEKFFAQYIGAEIDMPFDGRGLRPDGKITSWNLPMMAKGGFPILLRPISSITDAEAIEVANMAFLTGKKQWSISKRDKTGVWMDGVDHLNIGYYIRLNDYAEIYASSKYSPQEKYEHNIGRCGNSCLDGVPYVNIVDYLRSKGYATPYMGHSVAELEKAGWIKLVAV